MLGRTLTCARSRGALGMLLVVAALLALLAGSAGGKQSGSTTAAPSRVKPPSRTPIDPNRVQARREARARQRTLRTPAARARRRSSRTAYRGLSGPSALRVMRSAFPSLIDGPTFAGPSLGEGGKLKRYLGEHAAVLEDRGGRRSVVAGTAPLRVPDETGREAPVDMTLKRHAGFYAPANSATPVLLPSRLEQGLRLERSGLGLVPRADSDVRARKVGERLFYANAYRDSDVLIAPAAAGAEIFTQLRSARSPSKQSFGLRLPAGAVAGVAADGSGVEVTRGGDRLASIAAPVAWDADGQVVRTSYRLVGHELIISTAHRRGQYRYPITVDPYAIEDNDFRSADPGDASFIGWNYFQWRTGGTAVGVAQSGAEGRGLYLYASPGWTIPAGDYAAWTWRAPVDVNIFQSDSYASMVPFFGYFTMQRGIVNGGPAWAPGSPGNDNGVTLRDSRRLQCADGSVPATAPQSPAPPVCLNQSAGSLANEFWITYRADYAVTVGGTANTYAYLSHAWLYMHDGFTPTITGVTPAETAGTWRKGGTSVPPFTVSVTDRGLGMDQVDVTGGSVNAISKPQCLGRRDWRCPLSAPTSGWNTTFTYNTDQLPEGITTMTAAAHDIAGNVGRTTWQARVDKSEPGADTSGELDEVRDQPRLTTDSPTLNVYATDENDAGTLTSGVQSIEVLFDGTDPNPSTNLYRRPESSCDGCPLERLFQLNTSALGNGVHTVEVVTTDYAKNVSVQTWEFTIDRTTPKPSCSDPSADPVGCQPDPPSAVAASCSTAVPLQQQTGGTALTADQAIAQTQQTMPQALAASQATSIESLSVAPALTGSLLTYSSTGTIMPSKAGSPAPTYTVGSGTTSACVTPMATTPSAKPPTMVNGTALEYANTAPSTDTILRPTPLGMQEIEQIRDSSAPEVFQYQITLSPGQFLQKQENGAVAVIDPSVPTISSTEPPPPSPGPNPGVPLGQGSTADGWNQHDPSDDGEALAAEDMPGAVPEDQDISPPATDFQFESENSWLHWAEQDSDGQAVAVFMPPTAKDAFGSVIPTDIAFSGTNVLVVTTRHRSNAEGYPVMSSHKTATTKQARRQKVVYQLGAQQPAGLTATNAQNSPAPTGGADGAPTLIAGMKARQSRVIMVGPGSCDRFANGPDLRNAAWDGATDSNRCKAAVDTVLQMIQLGLTPYVTLKVLDTSFQPRPYARSMQRLWRSYPFSQIKLWGVINEPDLEGVPVAKAVKTFREVQRAANKKDPSTSKAWCRGCKINGGEFAINKPTTAAWTRDYIDYVASTKGSRPHFWAVHDYADVTWQEYHPHTRGYPVISSVRNRIKKHFGTRPRIWLSEQGVVVRRTRTRRTQIHGNRTDQREDAKRIYRLAGNSNQITQVAYYELFGERTAFDSALVEPVTPRGSLDGATKFRPAYCVLARRPVAQCAGSTGTSPDP
jgi:hypothetical protein